MKKYLRFFVFMLAAVFVFAACDSSGGGSGTPDPDPDPVPKQIAFYKDAAGTTELELAYYDEAQSGTYAKTRARRASGTAGSGTYKLYKLQPAKTLVSEGDFQSDGTTQTFTSAGGNEFTANLSTGAPVFEADIPLDNGETFPKPTLTVDKTRLFFGGLPVYTKDNKPYTGGDIDIYVKNYVPPENWVGTGNPFIDIMTLHIKDGELTLEMPEFPDNAFITGDEEEEGNLKYGELVYFIKKDGVEQPVILNLTQDGESWGFFYISGTGTMENTGWVFEEGNDGWYTSDEDDTLFPLRDILQEGEIAWIYEENPLLGAFTQEVNEGQTPEKVTFSADGTYTWSRVMANKTEAGTFRLNSNKLYVTPKDGSGERCYQVVIDMGGIGLAEYDSNGKMNEDWGWPDFARD